MLPDNYLIVFRRGMYATYGKKVRYYAEKKLAVRTKLPPPEMPTIRVDPAVARNSLRVIAAAEADENSPITRAATGSAASPSGASQQAAGILGPRRLNTAAIDAAKAVPPDERTARLFEHLVATEVRAA